MSDYCLLKEKFKEIEFTEEWQDDDIPGMPQDEGDTTDSSDDDDDDASTCSEDSTKNKPSEYLLYYSPSHLCDIHSSTHCRHVCLP